VENLAHLSVIDARIEKRRSFRHVIADLLDAFLNWDSKFFATIGLVLVRPWKLTNQFLANRLPLVGPPPQHAQDLVLCVRSRKDGKGIGEIAG
jgi:hypothetical protein